MQLLKGLVLATLAIASPNLLANECLVSTTPRALFSGVEQVAKEHFEPEKGEYSATLQDGSSIIARFELCGLGLRASYLIEHQSGNLSEEIKFLLEKAATSENSASAVAAQLMHYAEEDFRDGITLKEANGEHWVQAKDSPSPLYQMIIHYRWIPPEH